MFEAKLSNVNTFKKLIDGITGFVTDVNIDVGESGLALQAMDASHVAVLHLGLRSDSFEYFRTPKEQRFGVSIPAISKILKLALQDDSMTLKKTEDAAHLTVMFENEHRITQFKLNLLSIEDEIPDFPVLSKESEIQMNSNDFSKLIREYFSISDQLEFKTHPDSITLEAIGEIGEGQTILKPFEGEKPEDSVIIKCKERVEVAFSLRYLVMFTKAASIFPTIKLSLDGQGPLSLEYDMKQTDLNGSLKFFLAPKIKVE